jgi:hypothetical protein
MTLSTPSPYPANAYAAPYATQSQPALQQYLPTPRSVSATGSVSGAYPDRRRMESAGPIYPTTAKGTVSQSALLDSFDRTGYHADVASSSQGLTPAQAYQAAEGYGWGTVDSPSTSPSNTTPPADPIIRQVNGTLRTTQRMVPSKSQRSRNQIGELEEEGDISPPPTYSSHDIHGELDGRRQDTSTPPQLPDFSLPSTDLSFLDDLESLGLQSSSKLAKKEQRRDTEVEDRSRVPSNSHSSGSLTSQRHYEDEMRGECIGSSQGNEMKTDDPIGLSDQVTPVTNRQDTYMTRTGHRRQYSDSSVVSTSTVQSSMTQSRQFNG